MGVDSRKIRAIHVSARHRRDLGDLSDLKSSMVAIGLLHPIVVDEKNRLLAGQRRLSAAKELGWSEVPVRIVRTLDDAIKALNAERDENTCRKDFLPSEAVALARDLEPLERRAAQRRKGTSNNERAKLAPSNKGKAREKIAAAVGVPRTTLAKAERIVAAAERDPEKFEKLRDQMDRTGNVHGAFKQLKKREQADEINAEPPPLPTGPFRVIVADPPWQYDLRASDVTHRSNLPYPEMSIAAICAMPVGAMAADDCVLWLWTTNAHMRQSYDVLNAWGFESKTILTWGKQRFGAGNWLRGQTEHCHLAIRGKPTVLLTNHSTLLLASAGEHSAKPEEFYSKVELFARRAREGWSRHGNAVTVTVTA